LAKNSKISIVTINIKYFSTTFRLLELVLTSTLILAVVLAVAVSAFCSVLEAVLYSISTSQVEMLKKQGHNSAPLLQELREDIDEPITAILTLNTIAHTIGAAVAGAAAAVVFGEQNLILFSIVFTLIILLFQKYFQNHRYQLCGPASPLHRLSTSMDDYYPKTHCLALPTNDQTYPTT